MKLNLLSSYSKPEDHTSGVCKSVCVFVLECEEHMSPVQNYTRLEKFQLGEWKRAACIIHCAIPGLTVNLADPSSRPVFPRLGNVRMPTAVFRCFLSPYAFASTGPSLSQLYVCVCIYIYIYISIKPFCIKTKNKKNTISFSECQ